MSTSNDTPYPRVPNRADFPAIERSVLDRWNKEGTFRQSITARPENDEYVFYDGPPFANGLPHHGHLLTGYVKDVRATKRARQTLTAVSAGIITVYPPKWKLNKNWECQKSSHYRIRIETFNASCKSRFSSTPRNGKKRSRQASGSISKTTTKPWISPTWNPLCGLSNNSGTKGSFTKLSEDALLLGSRDTAIELFA